jgi:hypothetical protein
MLCLHGRSVALALGMALLSLGGMPLQAAPGAAPGRRDPARPPKAALFRAEGFPTADGPVLDAAVLDAALAGLPVETLSSSAALAEGLRGDRVDVLILPYGSAFPVDAWPAIRAFIRGGGGLVVLGGAPFQQPIRETTGAPRFVAATRQPTFAHDLLIGADDELRTADFGSALRTSPVPGSGWRATIPEPKRAWALTFRLATRPELPEEQGTAGPRDAVVRPLVHVVDALGVPRACPLLEVDRLRGDGAGGRWVLAPSDAVLPAAAIREAVERALEGPSQVEARPARASIDPGDAASIRVVVSRPGARAGETPAGRAALTVRNDDGRVVFEGEVVLEGPAEFRTGVARVTTAAPLAVGLYHAEVRLPDDGFRPGTVTTGFWVRDSALLASGEHLSASRDWIRRDGKVVPIVGTTYMASDVHRKFLFEPNPHAWDRDFADMARHGVNFVRTGLWTGWVRAMLDPGAVDEGVLSALDAYVLSAAKHGIPVCFNLFAFIPPSYGGTNPYLDPRALEGQKALLTLLASRYRGVPWIHWDLINEPSYAPPEGVWQNLPIGDENERRAWGEWLRARHGDDDGAIRDLWRDASGDLLGMPKGDEISQNFIRENRRPRKARDFAEFSQWVVAEWARTLRATLRAAGGDVLVTLGQDEGGTGTRPAQQLYYDALDYTAVHTWWNNDDLLWDGVVTKVPEKANLHQETGLMRLEDLDGNHWRTPAVAANLLERKFTYAFASRGAGAVQWAWNINPYQPIDNEAVIGIFRPDGTAKPELEVLSEFAAFFREAAPLLDDFEADPVVLVIPHSRLMAGRPGGVDATKRVVRLLAERYGVVPTALSELRLTSERLRGVRLVLVPSPEMLEEGAAKALLEASRAGTHVLVTGAVEGDSYGRETESLRTLGLKDAGRPLALHEPTTWGGLWATFEGHLSEKMRRSTAPEPRRLEGNLWHEPLPLEFARETEPLDALLGAALGAAGVPTLPSDTRIVARLLKAPKATLAICANETPVSGVRRVVIDGRHFDIPVGAGRGRMVLFEKGGGRVIASTPGDPVLPAR